MALWNIGSSSQSEAESKGSRFSWIPERDEDVDIIGKKITETWLANRENFVIMGKSPDKMLENSTLYHTSRVSIGQIDIGGGNRKDRWSELLNRGTLGKQQVVSYLKFLYPGKDIRPHLVDFGYEPKHGTKVFPMTQSDMGRAINQMIEGIKHHNMQNAPIGLQYWNETLEEYNDLMGIKDKKKRDRKPLIAEKNELKAQIQRYIRALKKHLEAVYDDNSEELEGVLLNWGFKKFFR